MITGIVWRVWHILPPVYLVQLRVQGLIILQQLGLLGRGELLAWVVPLAVLLAVVFLAGAVVVSTSRREWQP